MTIHFICRGNVYRSRLAETYLKSKQIPSLNIFSSGIEANRNFSGSISWYAQRIIQNEGIQVYEKPVWQQTTRELLESADLTIFMDKEIYSFCVNNLGFNNNNFKVWEIEDLIGVFDAQEAIKKTEETYLKIKQHTDELIILLKEQTEKSE